jgi:hypothetical protein
VQTLGIEKCVESLLSPPPHGRFGQIFCVLRHAAGSKKYVSGFQNITKKETNLSIICVHVKSFFY